MLSLIETLNYCCFKYFSQPLSPLNVLMGPHGSGKTVFPEDQITPKSILMSPRADRRWIFNKKPGGNDNYYSEVQKKDGGGWRPSFKLGPRKSAFGNLPQEQSLFPAATWFKEFLTQGIKTIRLNERLLKKPCSPGQTRQLKSNGANLPLVVKDLKTVDPQQFREWIALLKTVLPDIENIHIKEQQDTCKVYLTVAYHNGLEVPSWMLSGGTLRLLALTLPPFLKDTQGINIYKNPENGLPPDGINTVFEALASIHSAQMFISIHSPMLLNAASPDSVFCFEKNEQGASEIVPGKGHVI